MAKDYLAIMATSVSIESIFSEFGNIITKNRNALSDKIAIKTMLLKNWKIPKIIMDESDSEEEIEENDDNDESDLEFFN